MTLSERQKDLISMLVNERYTNARSYLPHILAEDKSKKNEAFVAKYLKILEQKPALPAAYQNVLQGGYPDEEEMKRYYLSEREKAVADTIRRMYRAADKLDKMRIHYVNSTLLYGPSGSGKTMFAKYIAYIMDLPLYYINFSTAVDSLLGGTAKNIGKAFQCAKERACVLFLDEIDCVAMTRKGSGREGADGELERTTISLMQNLDTLPNNVILLAATNRPDVIDPALMRRFSQKHEVQMLSEKEAEQMVERFFASIGQEMLYTAEEIKARYRETGSPADLMVRIVQDLAGKLAGEEMQDAGKQEQPRAEV